jgi:outer membrane cobalamin receptor
MKGAGMFKQLLLAAAVFIPGRTGAADTTATVADSSVKVLDKMTVTATRTNRRLSEIPASVSVIDKKDLELSTASNADDLIRNQPGVLVRRNVGMGEGIPGSIDIRGVPGAYAATRVLILVDGIPTNLSGAPFLIMNEVPLDAVERVEIVRGPFSSLYGANAFGGVISIFTRDENGKPRIRGNLVGGDWGHWEANAWSGGEIGKFGYKVMGQTRSMYNYFARNYVI